MVFALARSSGALRAFASALEATTSCKGADARRSKWLFFDDDGSPLETRFDMRALEGQSTAASDAYALQRAMSGLWLQERLEQVGTVEGCGLATVADLAERLKVNRGKRVAPRGKRPGPS